MKEKEALTTAADKIRYVADVWGITHGNQFIKEKVAEEFSNDVSDTQIVNTIGNQEYRSRVLDAGIAKAARELSLLCDQDKRLIYRAVNRYCG